MQSWVRLWTLHLSVTKTLFHIDLRSCCIGCASLQLQDVETEILNGKIRQVDQVGFGRFRCVSPGLRCSFRVHRLCQGTTPLVHHSIQYLDRHYVTTAFDSRLFVMFFWCMLPRWGYQMLEIEYMMICLQPKNIKKWYQAFCKLLVVGSV